MLPCQGVSNTIQKQERSVDLQKRTSLRRAFLGSRRRYVEVRIHQTGTGTCDGTADGVMPRIGIRLSFLSRLEAIGCSCKVGPSHCLISSVDEIASLVVDKAFSGLCTSVCFARLSGTSSLLMACSAQ